MPITCKTLCDEYQPFGQHVRGQSSFDRVNRYSHGIVLKHESRRSLEKLLLATKEEIYSSPCGKFFMC